jgi:hypothetical protein
MAAGLGFKTFAVGEVLSAANVNGYLMQGVLVFANAAARDAAITSPQEGQFAFTKDNDSLWYYSGSAWLGSGATGDIEGVTAGTGITGGGTSGTVTVAFDYSVGNQAIENTQTDSYTLVLSDAGKMITMNKGTANNLTVPPNSSVAFPINSRIDIIQYGAGQTTIVAGAGVTIRSSGAKLKITGQYSGASLWKKGTNEWVLIGDIAS